MVNGIELSNILTCHSSQIPRHNEFHIAFRPGMYIDPVGILYYKIEVQKLGLFFMPLLNLLRPWARLNGQLPI